MNDKPTVRQIAKTFQSHLRGLGISATCKHGHGIAAGAVRVDPRADIDHRFGAPELQEIYQFAASLGLTQFDGRTPNVYTHGHGREIWFSLPWVGPHPETLHEDENRVYEQVKRGDMEPGDAVRKLRELTGGCMDKRQAQRFVNQALLEKAQRSQGR